MELVLGSKLSQKSFEIKRDSTFHLSGVFLSPTGNTVFPFRGLLPPSTLGFGTGPGALLRRGHTYLFYREDASLTVEAIPQWEGPLGVSSELTANALLVRH